jgi:hypothetical protein
LRSLAAIALTAAPTRRATAPGIAIWWNDLLDGARRGPARSSAVALDAAVALGTMIVP